MPYLISIATLVAGILLWFSAPLLTHNTIPTTEPIASSTASSTSSDTKNKQEEKAKPNANTGAKNNVIAPTPVIQQTENTELKIAKCKAEKESFYASSVQKINQATDTRLKEIFASLQQQYKESMDKLFSSNADTKSASILAEAFYQNQQTYWKNQKAIVENSKQQAIDQINVLINAEYSKCLEK